MTGLLDGGQLEPMPCPHCPYIHHPTKSGLGLTMHVIDHHPEHVVKVPIDYAEDGGCPLCSARRALNGPFAGLVLHKSGCRGVREEPDVGLRG